MGGTCYRSSDMQHSSGFLNLVQDALTHVREITVDDAAFRATQPNTYLVDVREESEWNAGHANGAIHLGKGIIERDIETTIPDHSAQILLYCGGGYRSALAAENLQRMGYTNVSSITGGYKAWVAAKLLTTTRPSVVPRSPFDKIAGIYHLARLIDKVRLYPAGKLPGYNYLTIGFDKMLLEFLCVDPYAFEKAVQAAQTDDEVLSWLKNKLGPSFPTSHAISDFNDRISRRRPDNADKQAKFSDTVAKYPPTCRRPETYFDLIDLEEGRVERLNNV
jgi:rhodanese-related sulfurtransferase